MTASEDAEIGFWGAVAIGIGGMVGGGIFAVLGLSVQLSGGGAPLAFLLAGAVALVTAYAYARLSVALPSEGGTVEFINRAFGVGSLSGGFNVLLWLSYVVMLSLYASAFGSYGATLVGAPDSALIAHLLASAVILSLTLLNVAGSTFVGEAETLIVFAKLAILALFVGAGLFFVDPGRLSPSTWAGPLSLVAGGMVIFVAYEGFELIANTAGDVRRPERTLPRAFFVSVGLVIALYCAVAAVTVGNLSLPAIRGASDYALAAAARPFLGQFGFSLIAVAALLSTASAINATLYGAARVTFIVAQDGELPALLERKVWRRPVAGLVVTAGVTLLIANLVDLSRIATIGSAGFLLIFAAVNLAAFRLRRLVGANRTVCATGAVLCLAALIALVWQSIRSDPSGLLFLAALLLVSWGSEFAYFRHRRHAPSRNSATS